MPKERTQTDREIHGLTFPSEGEEIPLQTPVWGMTVTYTWRKEKDGAHRVLEKIEFSDFGKEPTLEKQFDLLKGFMEDYNPDLSKVRIINAEGS